MTSNVQLLNKNKTLVIVQGLKHGRETLSNEICNSGGISLGSSTTVMNMGVIFEQYFSLNSHIRQISRAALLYLWNNAKIRKIPPQKDADKLSHHALKSL